MDLHYCVHACALMGAISASSALCFLWLCAQLIYDPVCAQFGSAMCASPSCRKVASTATPPSSSRRWYLSRAPFTRRRRGWPRTAPEITARIHSLWVTWSSAQADKPARHHITSRSPPVMPLRSTPCHLVLVHNNSSDYSQIITAVVIENRKPCVL